MTPTPTDRDMEGQIPEDIWAAAGKAWSDLLTHEDRVTVIARAILLERERAGKVAEYVSGVIGQDAGANAIREAGRVIAKAIRRGA